MTASDLGRSLADHSTENRGTGGRMAPLPRATLRSCLVVGLWPTLCLVALIILWTATWSRIDHARSETIERATERARSGVDAYAGFVERSIRNSDQLLEIVRYRWAGGGLSLEGLKANGVFSGQQQWVGAAIIDADGYCLSASFGCLANKSLAFRDYFQFHRDHPEDVAHLGPAVRAIGGNTHDATVIHLSRRLVDAQGRFAGVAIVSLLEPYFTEFFAGSSLSDPDLIALVGADGQTRALRIGATSVSTSAPSVAGPQGLVGETGTARLGTGEWSASPQASLVAWKRLKDFPMYALVGLSEERVLKPWVAARRTALNTAIGWTVVLLALGGVATMATLRFVSKQAREDRVRAAYRVATEGTRDGLSFLEPLYDNQMRMIDLAFADCNEAAAKLLGTTRERLVGRRCAELLDATVLTHSLELFARAQLVGRVEATLQGCAVGPLIAEVLWVEHRIVRTGRGFAVTLRDVTEVVVHREQLEQMANDDRLTGLHNRNWLENEVATLLAQHPEGATGFALLFVDFDGFKRVNDSMGHSAGDALLREAAQRLRELLADEDVVVRLGGDEFVILIRSEVGEAELDQLAARVVLAFRPPFRLAQGEFKIGVSIGIAIYPQHGESVEELLRNADIAMYEVKSARRGSYSFFRPELFSAVKRRFEMEGAILNAIERNEFVLHFQPQFAIDTKMLVGFEALIRWLRPGRGLVLPADFVPIAEEAGLITRLGELVIEKACQQLSIWRAMELPIVPVSVNVSAIQFHNSDICATFEGALARYSIPAAMIQMEITESSMIGNEVSITEMLQQIRSLGIKISVDDFGTGYSSLSQLQQLRVDAIKIDRSFISKMLDSSEGEVFVHAIISMAHALAMQVVAEGVETTEQLDSLQRLKCEAAQGFLFSKPLAGPLATDLLVALSGPAPDRAGRSERRAAGLAFAAS